MPKKLARYVTKPEYTVEAVGNQSKAKTFLCDGCIISVPPLAQKLKRTGGREKPLHVDLRDGHVLQGGCEPLPGSVNLAASQVAKEVEPKKQKAVIDSHSTLAGRVAAVGRSWHLLCRCRCRWPS